MNNQHTIILTSLEKKELLASIPIKYHNLPTHTIKGNQSNPDHYLSLDCEDIQSLFRKTKKVILYEVTHTNDHLLQGTTRHITESILLFFKKCADQSGTSLYIFKNEKLLKITEYFLSASGTHEHFINNNQHAKNTVTSIQKMIPYVNLPAFQWLQIYFDWLEKFTLRLINVKKKENDFSFCVRGLKKPLLVLQRNARLEDDGITELILVDGFLNKEKGEKSPLGRFFFITSPENNHLYTTLVHYKPTLPWPIYRISQGLIHRFVMFSFKRYVEKLEK